MDTKTNMKNDQNHRWLAGSYLALLLAAFALPVCAQQPSNAERVALLKANLEASRIILRQYQWIETTVVTVKGEEKSRKQEKCYYGADGGLQKIELDGTPPPEKKRGLRGRIAERGREELTDYMKSAVALVKTYVPPTPASIQASKDAGKFSVDILDPGKRIRINFRDYQKPGDNLGIEVDLGSNRPLGVKVATYLDDAKDVVTLDVSMGQLNDGTSYASGITLNAKAKRLVVTVTNSGYQKAGQ